VHRSLRLAAGQAIAATLTSVLVACNAVFGVDDLTFDAGAATVASGGQAGESGGNGGSGSGGDGGGGYGGGGDGGGTGAGGGSAPITIALGEATDATVTGVTLDTKLTEDAPTEAFGAAIDIHADTSPNHVALLRFDLGVVPDAATVSAARLRLWVTSCNFCRLSNGVARVTEVLEPWQEGDVDGVPGVANWTERQPSTAWTSPGAGDGSVANGPMGEFFPGMPDTAYEVDLDLQVVNGWVHDPASNFGMRIHVTSPTGDGVGFHSSESPAADKRPLLTLTYLP
jgi:hypothetical protein